MAYLLLFPFLLLGFGVLFLHVIADDRLELSSIIKPPLPNTGALIRAIDESLCSGNDLCGNAPELSSTLLLALGLAFLKAFNDRSRRR